MARMGQAEISTIIKNYTHNLITSTYDFMLAAVYYQFDMGDVIQSDMSAINLKTFKRVIERLSANNLIVENADKKSGFDTTSGGIEKLKNILPQYEIQRPWDGKIYAITYDVPTSSNVLRNKLRFLLLDNKCSLYQSSVWISCYDPREFLKKFINENKALTDHILVTQLIDNNKNVALKAFGLEGLNERYANFIHLAENEFMSREEAIFAYLSVLKDDPQLPFEILPDNWSGNKAYEIFNRLSS